MSHEMLSRLMVSVVAVPTAAAFWLAAMLWLRRAPSEKTIARVSGTASAIQFFLSLFLFVKLWGTGFTADYGTWYYGITYTPTLRLVWDSLSAPMVLVSTFLCCITGFFSARYLHREAGYARFFLLFLVFSAGISLLYLAGTTELLIAGWEMVGLSSVMLISFFQFRATPVHNGLVAWITYRICDIGLIAGCAGWHRLTQGSVLPAVGAPTIYDGASPETLAFAGFLFLVAAVGKSAQLPASPWLIRAMEGPTPSSAIFYGALSVHAGAYLLLRFHPLLATTPVLLVAIVVIGLATAAYASFVGSTKSDAKTILAYATMAQLGLIFAEIGMGWRELALWHMVAHALLRMWQFLRAPSLLQDFNRLDLADKRLRALWSTPHSAPLYRLAMSGFHLEKFLGALLIIPVRLLSKAVDSFETKLIDTLEGSHVPSESVEVVRETEKMREVV